MSDDRLIDPRVDAAHKALDETAGFRFESSDAPWGLRSDEVAAALAAADAYDAEHGIIRVHQSSIDNDATRIAAAQRAGQEIRQALRLPATASWAEVLAAASGQPRYLSGLAGLVPL